MTSSARSYGHLPKRSVTKSEIVQIITAVIDDSGNVKDNASRALMDIRMDLDKSQTAAT